MEEVKKVGRVKIYTNGWVQEYKDTNYFNKYYHNHKERYQCDMCNKSVNTRCRAQHNKSKMHIRFCELLENK